MYYDAAEGPELPWAAAGTTTTAAEMSVKVDELLLEELEEAWELETRAGFDQFDDDVSVSGSVFTRRTRASALVDPVDVDMKLKEMAAMRQALDFAMTNMLQRQSR